MYAKKENKKSLNNAESEPKDISENQIHTFHVEHKTQINKDLKKYEPLTYNMKKFKAITITGIEFLFAPTKEQARKMFFQLYPCGILTGLEQVQINL